MIELPVVPDILMQYNELIIIFYVTLITMYIVYNIYITIMHQSKYIGAAYVQWITYLFLNDEFSNSLCSIICNN